MKLEPQEMELEKVEIPDLRRLKELSERLHLSPKRESVMQWHYDLEKLQSQGIYPSLSKPTDDGEKEKSDSKERRTPEGNTATAASDSNEASAENTPLIHVTSAIACESANTCDVIIASDSADAQTTTSAPCLEMNADPPSDDLERLKDVTLRGDRRNSVANKTNNKRFFKQRSAEGCQETIRRYALRDDSTDDTDVTEQQKSDNQCNRSQRYKLIGQALERIRTDLLDMRIQDNALARQLLESREKFMQVKAEKSCEEHAKLLEHFTFELEIEEELTEQLRSFDLPSAFLRPPDSLLRGSSPLRLMGISRMTMESQRFSVI